jgi:hypothetical protein
MPPLEERKYFVDLSCCNMIAEKAAAGPNVAQPFVELAVQDWLVSLI